MCRQTQLQQSFDFGDQTLKGDGEKRESYFLDLRKGSQPVPGTTMNHILEVRTEIGCFELGFAVPHKKHEPYFSDLKVCSTPVTLSEINRVIKAIIEIMRYDASYSDWVWNRRNSVSIHIPEGRLERSLREEVESFKTRKVAYQLKDCQYRAGEDIVIGIYSEDDFRRIMSVTPDDKRLQVKESINEVADRLRESYTKKQKIVKSTANLAKEIKMLKEEGLPVRGLEKSLRSMREIEAPKRRPPSRDQLDEWFENTYSVPVISDPQVRIRVISDIIAYKTTLHERASKSYDPSIKTFRIME